MRIGVKYCGGCNPRYDRTALTARLQMAWPQAQWVPARPGEALDAVLVVCGCTAACAERSELAGKYGLLVVRPPEQERQTLEWLRKLQELEEKGDGLEGLV